MCSSDLDLCIVVDSTGESPPSFCDGLGTIYIASSQGKAFLILLLEIWVQSLGMVLGRC